MGIRSSTPAAATTPTPSSPTPSGPSAPPPLREFQRNELRYLSDEEQTEMSIGGALELRRLGDKIVTMKMSAVQDPKQFKKEVAAVSTFAPHPCVVDILGLFNSEVASFVVVEYLKGGSLEQLLQTSEKFTWDQIISFGVDICKGMAHVHKAGVVHRNLKPSNVLVVSTSSAAPVRVKVSDFGLARLVAAKMTGKRGPVAYMAPELLKKSEADYNNSVDVYSFGIILWQLITRGEPYHGISFVEIPQQTLTGNRPPIPESTPPVLADLLRSLWNQDPSRRPTFEQAQETLSGALKQQSNFPPVSSCSLGP